MLDPDLHAWIIDVTGARAVTADRRSAGASREGWAVDAQHADGHVDPLWLRLDTGHGPLSGTGYTLRREATVYRALAATAVRVPRVIAVHPTRDAFLETRLDGRNWFAEIADAEEQEAVARDFMGQLAELHKLDPSELDLPGFGAGASLREHVLAELDTWEHQFRASSPDPEPIVLLALRWLRRHLPSEARVVLVQGDTGPGNFMYADGRVVAVLDWEIAHLGDPHDDLAWICVRDLQERFTHLPDRFRDYERAGGARVDLDRLRYFRVLAQTRCAIGTLRGLAAHDASGEIANHLIYSTLHLRVLVEALAEVVGAEASADELHDPGPTPQTPLYDVALEDLRATIVPNAATAFAARRAKGLARLVKYLREVDRLGATAAQAELADLDVLLAAAPSSVAAGRAVLRAAIDAGELDDVDVVTYGLRRCARLTRMMRDAMGALADRHYAPIA